MTPALPTLSDLWDEGTWLEWRSRIDHLTPIRLDTLTTTEQSRGEFIQGARLTPPRSASGGRGMGGAVPLLCSSSSLTYSRRAGS